MRTRRNIYVAQIFIEIQTNEPTSFFTSSPDWINLSLNPDDLDILQVKYILSPNDLPQYNSDEQPFKLLAQEGNYNIFEVVYTGDAS